MSAPPGRPRLRRLVRDDFRIGQTVQDKSCEAIYQICQVWRRDKQVQLIGGGGKRFTVSYMDFRRNYRTEA